MNYSFHPAAEAEHLETIAFYEARQAGVGARYLGAFERAVALAMEAPERHDRSHA